MTEEKCEGPGVAGFSALKVWCPHYTQSGSSNF